MARQEVARYDPWTFCGEPNTFRSWRPTAHP
jgi:hypothetical protein